MKENKYFCSFLKNGAFFTHRYQKLCCTSKIPYNGFSPKEFWFGQVRRTASKKMMNAEPVNDCTVCYDKEDLRQVSQRMEYNKFDNTVQRMEYNKFYNTVSSNSQELPTSMDLDLSNFCNLKCIMCSASRSSQWAKEKNLYKDTNGVKSLSYDHIDEICELSHNLRYLTLQGGEPSMMPEYNYYFDYLIKNNLAEKIQLHVISNATNINNKFYSQLQKFEKVTIGVSVDAYGSANDYLRFPSKFDKISSNIKKLIENKFEVVVQYTLQNLSILSMIEYFEWFQGLEEHAKKYNSNLNLGISKVYHPKVLSFYNMSDKLQKKLEDNCEFIKERCKGRTAQPMKAHLSAIQKEFKTNSFYDKKGLLNYINDLDMRRNIKITDYIPEFYEFIQ